MRRAARAPAPRSLRANAVCSESSIPQDLEAVYVTPPCLQLASSAAVGHGADSLGGVHASPAAAGGGGTAANANIVLEPFPVAFEGVDYEGWIAYEKGAPPLPQVLVIPNYAGLKQFDKDVAVFLASVGFVGIAVDIYAEEIEGYSVADRAPNLQPGWRELTREKKVAIAAAHTEGAFKHVDRCVCNPGFFRDSLEAYLVAGRAHPAVHPTRAAAIGYCFGGMAILEMVRGGLEFDAAVSFHGVLQSRPSSRDMEVIERENVYGGSTKVLMENGDLDHLVTEKSYQRWKDEMDEHGIDWRFNNHGGGCDHGFALAKGCFNNVYHEAADRRSTLSMLSLFAECWPDVTQRPVATNACGTVLNQAIEVPGAAAKL